MRTFFRSRRGSVAFATAIALVPVIGVVALGAEAGSWYVTRQHAQNAADAAAYSGALRLACSQSSSCADGATTVDYRGKQFAAQNAFCDDGDTTAYPGRRCATLSSGTSQSVTIEPTGNQVRATITQTQPAYLATVLGLSSVTIGATAVAQVETLANPCVLSLSDPIAFQGSTNIQAPNCGLASNSAASNSMDFTGNGLTVNAGSISGQGACHDTGGSQCSIAITYAPPVPDPLSALKTAMASLTATSATFANGACPNPTGNSAPQAYDVTHKCYTVAGNGNGKFKFGNATYNLSGVYFFSGDLSITSNSTVINGTALIVLLPGATLNINGGTIKLTGPTGISTQQVPPALQPVVSLMDNLVIYDSETTSGNQQVRITGNSGSYFNGIVYAPNASVLYQGSSTQAYTCVEVIAKGITLSGSSNFSNSGCPSATTPKSKIVRLVQ